MLEIIDINTNSTRLEEVEQLKSEFREYLSPTVKDGLVIIISDFPSFWNFAGKIDYVVFVKIIKKNGNYLKVKVGNKNCYLNSSITAIKRISNDSIERADEEYLYSNIGKFDYKESITNQNYQFQDYLSKIDFTKTNTIFDLATNKSLKYKNFRITINNKITAKYIISSAVENYIESGANKFSAFSSKDKDEDSSLDVVYFKDVLDSTNESSEDGILTIKKLKKISTSTKDVENIYSNLGNILSIITGNAGTGKTLALMRLMHKLIVNKKSVKFLTYNNLLVFDIKRNLRNFSDYNTVNIHISTVHKYFYDIAKSSGIILLLTETRIKELLEVCFSRVERIRNSYSIYMNTNNGPYNQDEFYKLIIKENNNKSDYQEFIDFTKYLRSVKVFREFDKIKLDYTESRKKLLIGNVGLSIFLKDYYKVIEIIYMAFTDTDKFYEQLDIKNRYDLLAKLYDLDKSSITKELSLSEVTEKIESVRIENSWHDCVVVDEGQDFHILEKEIIYHFTGHKNSVVATGGKEQLIRLPELLDWSVSLSKKKAHQIFKLKGTSFRQKQNLTSFINGFAKLFNIPLSLESISESKGLGRVIVDTRLKKSIVDPLTAKELSTFGQINGCSEYESLLMLIPSAGYTEKNGSNGSFVVDSDDHFRPSKATVDRKVNGISDLNNAGLSCWDGVSEEKGHLKVPFNDQTRVIHYESCRGLEAWSCACMSMDEYFSYKASTDEAGYHLAGDLIYKEEERREKYAALWCLMAFTRPIDTLYIHLVDVSSKFSKSILELSKNIPGVTILKNT